MVNEAVVSETNANQPRQPTPLTDDEEVQAAHGVVDRERGLVEVKTANKQCCLHIRVLPLPPDVVRLLDEKVDLIRTLVSLSSGVDRKQKEEKVRIMRSWFANEVLLGDSVVRNWTVEQLHSWNEV